MKNILLKLTLVTCLLISLGSCQSTEEGTKFTDQFFETLVNEEYKKAASLFENELLNDTLLIKNLENFADNPEMGKLQTAEKTFGFNTSISNGITTVKLPYGLTFEQGSINVEVTVVDRGNGYKIQAIN